MSAASSPDLLAVYATTVAPELARTLDLGGYRWKSVATAAEAAEHEPPEGWAGMVVDATADSVTAWAFIRSFRKSSSASASTRLLVLISGAQISDLELRDELFDDFCLLPVHPAELEARVRHLLWRTGAEPQADLVEYRELMLNVATYQASIAGRPLDLTYMEYELLKFLSQNPGKVFTREVLLNRVWGYEYYGGARTVDVHVRRLRAKLGEEYASMIETVRSVGYRFGQTRWS
ncbi:response regulator transcription factor [Desertimonas flava]|jgi:DNA-binding response OmpR family regulator|uniref:response regulator transcription factor n=1 Tax=Desertimonas flava TaxID=2064846 RepID=UPI0023E20AC0|nr:response regulator transcription factor [Desertimonas flava]